MNAAGRWLFGLALVLSWANSALHVALPDRSMYAPNRRTFRGLPALGRVLPLVLASLVYVALVVAFLRGVAEEAAALLILAALASIRRVEIGRWPGDLVVRLGKYAPSAACLLAWLVGKLALGALGWSQASARVLAWNASCGVMAAAYFLAGIAKYREAGIGWMNPQHQALLVAERAFAGPAVLRRMRLFIVRSRVMSRSMGIAGFVGEFAAAAFVFPAARPAVLALIFSLHLGFVLLLGYFEPEWLAVMLAVTLLASGAPVTG
jgi:hypothetical protein